MSELSAVSETLYIPLLGRIYASRRNPEVLFDPKALRLADKIPENCAGLSGQTEYTFLASATRSRNMDDYLQAFLSKNPDGVVVNLGCGLETAYYRNDNGRALWFELDLPEVLALRSSLLPEEKRDRYLAYSLFDYAWMDAMGGAADKPIMVVASGLFYYFREEKVVDFIRHLSRFRDVQLVFDAVSSAGIRRTRRYMDKMGKNDARMFFSVDNAEAFVARISPGTAVVGERGFYSRVKSGSGIGFSARCAMFVSDAFHMVKMVHLRVG